MQGAMFDFASGMEGTLGALIQNAVWNRIWSHSELDCDRITSVIYFLCWQIIMPKDRKPFSGRSLYALLYMATYVDVLGSSGYGSKGYMPDPVMSEMAQLLIKQLSPNDAADFITFCTDYMHFHEKEYALYVQGEKAAAKYTKAASASGSALKGKELLRPLSIPYARNSDDYDSDSGDEGTTTAETNHNSGEEAMDEGDVQEESEEESEEDEDFDGDEDGEEEEEEDGEEMDMDTTVD